LGYRRHKDTGFSLKLFHETVRWRIIIADKRQGEREGSLWRCVVEKLQREMDEET